VATQHCISQITETWKSKLKKNAARHWDKLKCSICKAGVCTHTPVATMCAVSYEQGLHAQTVYLFLVTNQSRGLGQQRMLGVSRVWKGIYRLKPVKAHCCLCKSFVSCLVFTVSFVLSGVYAPPGAGLAKPGRLSQSSNELRDKQLPYQLMHSTGIAVYLK